MNARAPLTTGIVVGSTIDGGAEKYLRELYTRLSDFAITGHLLGGLPRWDDTGLPSAFLDFGPKWSRGSFVSNVRRLTADRRLVAIACQYAEVHRIDLHHMQFKREQVLFTRELSGLGPVVWTEHGRFKIKGLTRAVAAGYRHAARFTSAIICVSPAVRDHVSALCGSAAQRIEVIPNGVDTAFYHPPTPSEREAARESLRLPRDAPVVAVVSRLHPRKRIDLAIEAVAKLDGVTIAIAGDGPDAERLRRLPSASAARFIGHVRDPRVVYAAADCLVCSSVAATGEGGSPLAVLEGAASGLPVVAITGSGVESEIADGAGVIVEPDPYDLARGIEKALLGSGSGRARQWALRRDIGKTVAAHAALFNEIVGSRAPIVEPFRRAV